MLPALIAKPVISSKILFLFFIATLGHTELAEVVLSRIGSEGAHLVKGLTVNLAGQAVGHHALSLVG